MSSAGGSSLHTVDMASVSQATIVPRSPFGDEVSMVRVPLLIVTECC